MSAGAGGAAAAAAAAAEAERRRAEEEEMTPYSDRDLADGWEFKILRSNTRGFRDPGKLRAVLDEEGRAGWTLVEKFDDNRIRLKRPASARQLDGKLDFDAYRTTIGIGEGAQAAIIVGVVVGIMLLILLLILLLKG